MAARWREIKGFSPVGLMVLAAIITLFLNGCFLGLIAAGAVPVSETFVWSEQALNLLLLLPLVTGVAFGLFAAIYNVVAGRFGGVKVLLRELEDASD